ncbi:MAG TPA: efflux RND transporter periplasmic adaptor subunit [Dongiaceae bacterium]|jgi:membrane fusion protein (multidrug efflux system)
MRLAWLLFVLIIAAGAAVGYWTWFAPPAANGETAGNSGSTAPIAVEATAVRIDTVLRQIRAVGTLRSNESVVIASEVTGRILEIAGAEGQEVVRGRVILRLDPAIYEAELAQARAALALSQRNFKRANDLKASGAGTARALDEATASLRSDEAAVSLAEARLAKTQIAAPFSGVLGLRRMSAGAYVNPGDMIVNLEQIDPLKVDFRIPENALASANVGQPVIVTIDALPGQTFEGQVYAVDPQVDETARNIILRATLPNPDGRLRPGLFARVSLVVERHENAILVPERALVPMAEDQFVFRVVEGKAVQTRVRLGERVGNEVEVIEGLTAADLVITDGVLKIRDGSPVDILQQPAGQS